MPVVQQKRAITRSSIALTTLRGREVLGDPSVNKGTAFTAQERTLLGLHGLLPTRIETLEDQLLATRHKYDALADDMARHIFLRALEDTNEVLFYAFLERHLEELLPIVYTPTVGEACQRFSQIYRRPHGLFLSYQDRDLLSAQLSAVNGPVDIIVVTDGERVLGLGDQGLGGMGIPIGKLALYTAVGGVDPKRTLPILLDMGTNNEELLADPMYLGARHRRVTGPQADDYLADFVTAIRQRFPGALLQWEDFGGTHAQVLLDRYRDVLPSFNDDIQGTAAVTLAALRSASTASGLPLVEQRVCIVGAGAAGCGIAAMIRNAGRSDGGTPRVVLVDADGIVHTRRPDLTPHQHDVAVDLATFDRPPPAGAELADVVDWLGATTLIGVSGSGGLFTERVVAAMASDHPRIVFPLSNPTTSAEASPADVLSWTDGDALVATGSPFAPVTHRGRQHEISQANNVYVFPGLGLGAVVSGATRISDRMVEVAAETLASLSPASAEDGLLPSLSESRSVSRAIAIAVAEAAIASGLADHELDDVPAAVDAATFRPVYPDVRQGAPAVM